MYDFLLTEEQRSIRDEARDLVKWVPRQMILDMDADAIKFPKEFLQEAGRRNLLGCRYPKKWGGRGLDWVTTCLLMEEIGTLGYELACVFGVGAELVCDAIILHGTDAQKERYVKPLLRGERFAAECLTEPRGGSDFFGATTKAEDKGDHFVLNGQKRFIVGAEGADFFLVYARSNPGGKAPGCDFLLHRRSGARRRDEVSLRPHGLPRRRDGPPRVQGRQGPEGKRGREDPRGLRGLQHDDDPERLGTAAMTIGAARAALDVATAYTTRRKAFGQVINQFQGVSFQVAEAAMLLDACRAMVYMTARAVDAGANVNLIRRLVSESKKFITESCQKVVHNAMQVMGGIGYTNVFPVERIFRDIRLASIWTGTSEVMSLITAHEWYREHFERKGKLPRDYEADAAEAHAADEKVYDDEDMWKKGWE